MMLGKRQLQNKSFSWKYSAFKNLKKDLSYKEIAAKDGVPRITLSTWMKNKKRFS